MNFDHYAKTWDTDRRIARAKIIGSEIKNILDVSKPSRAMEFGCGTGLISFYLYDHFDSITLVDSSAGMIDILSSKINTYGIENMIPHHIDLTKDNLMDSKFDIIYTSMVLHHISDTREILTNLYDLLSDHGELCIVDLDQEDGSFHHDSPDFHGHNGFDQMILKKDLEMIGFQNIVSHTFYHDEKIIHDQSVPYSLFIMKGKKVR